MRVYARAAQVISEWLDKRGMTAADLSRQTEIDAGILRDIMTGRKTSISTRNLLILARFFNLEMQEMIDLIS